MNYTEQPVRGPFSPGVTVAETHGVERTVLAVVHHGAAAGRLGDVVPLVERDRRVQVVYTVPPSSLYVGGAHDFLRDARALVMPWPQATHTRFDLAVAAGQGLLDRVHAPVMTLSHGAGPNAYVRRRDGDGPPAARAVTGLAPQCLTTHGRVIPAAIMLGHEDHRRLLAGQCPEAVPSAVVAGDPCFDRMLAGRHLRAAYRAALGAGPGHTVVVVSSHYAPGSLLGPPCLLSRLAAELDPAHHLTVVILHPAVWALHGHRQIVAWFEPLARTGAVLLPPEEGWRAALVAADVLLADRGSPACYGAALGLPVLLAPYDPGDVIPGSQFAALGEIAPRLTGAPLARQLEAARRGWPSGAAAVMRERLTSLPGGAARVIRQTMYRLLRLAEPPGSPLTEPVPAPEPLRFSRPVT
ncbi:hypothetical protein [Sphaerisporangium sp. TRM90804]|uniref:hypothetical protein n=1 Tax=Sphaerisporangium sp. TRM90804 TaxID=3031113 RepID=UPI00244C2333|nr:hypothetical protein [Sphaerisporangium sp. TRM90804]MDH2424913.1 hypothetical protein [Sphaerisporangium sp. TRM90804]